MRFFSFLALAATAVAAPVPKDAPQPNLVVNGSFEDGPTIDRFKPLDPKSTDIKGWTVTRGQIDLIGTFWDSQDGKRSVDLHGSPGLGGIQQTVPTVKGTKYTLTFYLAATPVCQKPKKTMAVEIDKAVTKFTCEASGKERKPNWEKQTVTFTATDKETTIEFYTLETEEPDCGPAIDNVSVVRAK